MAVSVLICDDNPAQAGSLESFVLEHFPLLPVRTFVYGSELLHFVQSNPGEYIFLLDVVLGQRQDGIALAKKLLELDASAQVIFISAYLEKACDVYDVDHCYFVFKPQKHKRLVPAIEKALESFGRTQPTLSVHEGSSVVRLAPKEILYGERVRRYTFLYLKDRTIRVHETFDELLAQLPDEFVQCHRSYLVNMARTRAFKTPDFVMEDETLVPVSRSFLPEIKERYAQFVLHSTRRNEK